MTKNYLFWDTETHNAGSQYGMQPREFVRTLQYAWNDGPVHITTDYDKMIRLVEEADFLVAHNQISYDLSVLYGQHSMRPLELALDKRVIDTYVLATLVNPAPYSYTNHAGHKVFNAQEPERAKKWFSLEEQANQLGVPGKMGNLQALAKKYNPPKTPVKELDYGLISLNDTNFLAYAIQDVVADRHIYQELIRRVKEQDYPGDYIWREMLIWSINAQITRNGWLVDQEEAKKRVEELAAERDEQMSWLIEEFGMPTNTKMPWKSNAGKEVILKAFESFGITPEDPKWTATPKGAPSFSGETMLEISKDTDAEPLGRAIATLQGQRSLAQLALDSTKEDGRIHPEIACLQRSSRTSVQKPGLTVWTARGPGSVEKRYFIADPGSKLVEMDYSAADSRAVAAVSGDKEFAKRLEPGVDAHDLTGEIFFGKLPYHADRENLRPLAKIGGHALAYRIGVAKLADQLGVSESMAREFIRSYQDYYPDVLRWQNEVTKEGESGFVTNAWKRRMVVDPSRSYTQSSGLIGQSTTREVLFDGLIRIAVDKPECLRWLRATVHDAAIWCIPETELDWAPDYLKGKMEMMFDPHTLHSQPIRFTMESGEPADNWFEASH